MIDQFNTAIEYKQLDGGEDDSSLDLREDESKLGPQNSTSKERPSGKSCIVLVLVSLGTAVIAALVSFLVVNYLKGPRWVDCGDSASEARERGCKFDLMMSSWLQPACVDEELSEQFLKDGNWSWYLNSDGTNELSQELARLGEHLHVYADSKFHAMHCKYLIEKLSRSIASKRGIDDHSWQPGTIQHCTRMLLHFDSPTYYFTPRNGSSLRTSFKKCRIL